MTKPTTPTIGAVATVSVLVAAMLTFASAAHADPGGGSLDSSFGAGGVVRTDFEASTPASSDVVNAVALQSDGRIVAAGSTTVSRDSDVAVTRYNTDGTLDPSFGTGGKVTTSLGTPTDQAEAVAVQPDGKIVIAGHAGSGYVLARYDPDGTLDSAFGAGGEVGPFSGAANDLRALALQPDGDIVAVGYSNSGLGPGAGSGISVLRFNPNGTPDMSFGSGGVSYVLFAYNGQYSRDVGNALAVQPDGQIVVAGSDIAPGSSDQNFALIRLTPTGTLDSTFGTGGKLTTSFGSSAEEATGMALQADGKIVAAGYSFLSGRNVVALARYNPDGTLDTTFGSGGQRTTPIGAFSAKATATTVQADNKIVVAGFASNGSDDDFALARYNPDGTLDSTFGTAGTTTTAIGTSDDHANAMLIATDGTILAAGSTQTTDCTNSPYTTFALARYQPAGSLDSSFGAGGVVRTGFEASTPASSDVVNAVALQSDGRIVAAGSTTVSRDSDVAVTRYNTDGTLDPSFGTGGKVTTSLGTPTDQAEAVAVQPDGKIVIAGHAGSGYVLARYDPDGTLDSAFGAGGEVGPFSGAANDLRALALQPDGDIVAVGYSNSGLGPGAGSGISVLRFNPNGTPDMSFGSGGVSYVLFAYNGQYSHDVGNALAVQPDGQIVVAGSDIAPGSSDQNFALIRLTPTGTLDSTFGTGGKLTTSFGSSAEEATGMALQADGKIVATATAFSPAGTSSPWPATTPTALSTPPSGAAGNAPPPSAP